MAAALALPVTGGIGCGGGESSGSGKSGLAWEGEPTLTATPLGARIVAGKVTNGALDNTKIRIRAPDVKVLDREGRRIMASVAFVSGFVRSLYPQNGRPGMTMDEFPEAEQRRIGHLAIMRPGETLPLTVSWKEPRGRRVAVRIDTGHGVLAVPKTALRVSSPDPG